MAFLCWISIVVCLDPAGSYPRLPEGPGLTVDEVFNVQQGVYLVEQARALGWLNLIPGTSQEAYRVENHYNPDHPPLGRWWLGVHHHLAWWLAPPFHPEGHFVTACARTGSATAFALTVLMTGLFAARWFGRPAGLLTAISLVLMPRLYGHAHLASLETVTNLTCTAAVLGLANWWSGTAPPSRKVALLTGALLGLALLTKIQAVLIPIPVVCWALWRWRVKAVVPLVIWGCVAFAVFFVGWPYLWFDSSTHLLEYLGRTTNRATIQVWYLGQKFADKQVPWHYPFVMFGLTVPVVLHALGLWGLIRTGGDHLRFLREGRAARPELAPSTATSPTASLSQPLASTEAAFAGGVLVLACALFPLVIFALPGVAVYDGERLFLTSFPLWAIFVGRGGAACWEWLCRRTQCQRWATVFCSALLLISATPLITMSPCHLGYYNEVVTYLPGGADRAGLEIDYWGEGITRGLLQQLVKTVPEGANVAVLPTMHPFQADDYRRQSPILREHGIKTVEFHRTSGQPQFVLIYRRRADLDQQWESVKPDEQQGATTRHGSLLAYFIRLDP